ncbi:ATP-binding protein [Streptomyces rimosus]|uniref:ATP-binding protein n=1 Tax=Streptomyces rimosus TaxID=1927 RepID=UPI00067DC75A|nr:ATP-binding protein [Streptomyces rimosus]
MRALTGPGRHTDRVEYALPGKDTSPGRARHLTSDFLTGPTVPAATANQVDTALLIVSELVTNAIRHGGRRCRLRLATGPTGMTIEVHDDGRSLPVLRPLTADDTGGRGMALVDSLAQQLEVTCDRAGGKTVRAVLATT